MTILQTELKPWYQSKTIWLAMVQGAIAVVLVFQEANPEMGYLILAKSFLDVLLRYITVDTIERKTDK